MILLELETFEVFADLGLIEEGREDLFCPMFVFIIDWSFKRGFLSSELLAEPFFSESYSKLRTGDLQFTDFVFNVLDGKIVDSNFKKGEPRKFVSDYIEFKGYQDVLRGYFKNALFCLPHDFDESEELYRLIDKHYENYLENQRNHPDIVVFHDPLKVNEEQLEAKKE